MPYASAAQQRLFHAMENRGEMSHKKVHEWDQATKKEKGGFKALPEHVHRKEAAEVSPFIAGFCDELSKHAGVLTAHARKHIAKKNFALPAKDKGARGSYPIHDENHARNALSRVAQYGTLEEQARVRAKVHAKYPHLGGAKSAAKDH